jgi:hypothetical protein
MVEHPPQPALAMSHWIDLKQDAETGIESVRAHFTGHAYDPHWHDSFLVGVTEQGVQQFNCRRVRHQSTPGQVFLLEPGDLHDGLAPTAEGFTYSTLYLDSHWLETNCARCSSRHPATPSPASPPPCTAIRGWPAPPAAHSTPCTSRTCASSARPPSTTCWPASPATCSGAGASTLTRACR